MEENKDGFGIGILKFIRGIGFCMFFMSIGLMFRGGEMAVAGICGAFGIGLGVAMNLAIQKARGSYAQ